MLADKVKRKEIEEVMTIRTPRKKCLKIGSEIEHLFYGRVVVHCSMHTFIIRHIFQRSRFQLY